MIDIFPTPAAAAVAATIKKDIEIRRRILVKAVIALARHEHSCTQPSLQIKIYLPTYLLNGLLILGWQTVVVYLC